MPVRVGPQAQTLPRPGRPIAPNAGYAWLVEPISGLASARYGLSVPVNLTCGYEMSALDVSKESPKPRCS